MHNKTNSASLTAQKKQINAKLKVLEKELLSAKNDFFLVQAIDKAIDLLHPEINSWLSIVGQENDNESEDLDNVINEASIHVGNLQSILDVFLANRSLYIDNALKIQLAMINSHQLKSAFIVSVHPTQQNG